MKQLATKSPTTKYLLALAGVAALFVTAQASATVINFEDVQTNPALTTYNLQDNSPLSLNSNPISTNHLPKQDVPFSYNNTGGTLTFQGGFLEHTGDVNLTGDPATNDSNPQGFLYDKAGVHDVQNPNFSTLQPGVPGLGNWFLRTGSNIKDRGPDGTFGGGIFMKILYDSVVNGASGQIWDIDGHGKKSEQWEVLAYNGTTLVTQDTSPTGTKTGDGSLDGLPWTFSLSSATGFDRIEFKFIGGKKNNIGLAFDNFNATSAVSVPAPASTLGMFGFGLGLLGLGVAARRRSQVRLGAK